MSGVLDGQGTSPISHSRSMSNGGNIDSRSSKDRSRSFTIKRCWQSNLGRKRGSGRRGVSGGRYGRRWDDRRVSQWLLRKGWMPSSSGLGRNGRRYQTGVASFASISFGRSREFRLRFVLQLLISLSDIFPQSDPLVDALDWDSLLVQ